MNLNATDPSAVEQSTQTLRIGTLLPTRELAITGNHDPAATIKLAQRLEGAGVASLWVGESVLARPRHDTYTLLAALAVATESAYLGTAVVLPSLRNPVAFAHQVATLDQLSHGRLILGVGAGFPGPATEHEFDTLGADYRRRVSGIEATLDAAQSIWAGAATSRPATDRSGRFGFEDLELTPPATTTMGPPTWLATATPAGLHRCGRRHDGWLPYPTSPEDYESGLAVVRSAGAEADRDPNTITPALYITVAIGADGHEKLDQYCEAYYGGPASLVGLVQGMVAGSTSEVAERISQYVEAGARHIVIRHGTLDGDLIATEAPELHEAIRTMIAA